MKSTCLLFISLLSGIAACQSNASSGLTVQTGVTEEPANKRQVILPEAANSYVQKHVTGWEIATDADYAHLWWSFYDRDEIPFAVSADFNDDKLADYAYVIKKADSVGLVILTGTGNTFRHWLAPDFKIDLKKSGIEHGISVVPPGQVDVLRPEMKSVVLKSNGIALKEFEMRTKLYYWEDGRFKVLLGQ
ncbi:hypothetical protein [Pedobacter sp. SYSU D00535]|uniref:hypothetical protein n=1 Tax=Pedobacter sp. SYSU D00535 TaxID=2810308 RepID=UPI001A97BA36|nr:hypothetical protein [Pedobacter sp. SYSU D00535]